MKSSFMVWATLPFVLLGAGILIAALVVGEKIENFWYWVWGLK